MNSYQYMIDIIDVHTRFTILIPIKYKSEAARALTQAIIFIRTLTGYSVQDMHTDEGSEVINNWLKDWLKNENINHLISTTDTPQLNSFVERNNGKLVHQSNVMMQHSNSHKLLWQFAICYAVYVQNRTPHTGIEEKIPYKMLFPNREINYDMMKVFGCDAFVNIDSKKRGKFDKTTKRGIFIGIDLQYNAFRILTFVKLKPNSPEFIPQVLSTMHVSFNESSFNHMEEFRPYLDTLHAEIHYTADDTEEEYEIDYIDDMKMENDQPVYLIYWKGFKNPTWVPQKQCNNISKVLKEYHDRNEGRGAPPTFEICYVNIFGEESDERIKNVKDDIEFFYHLQLYKIPKTLASAVKHSDSDKWLEAYFDELYSLVEKDVFEEVEEITPEDKLVNTRVVFDIKLDKNNRIQRWKARIVAKGYEQIKGLHYDETFSPTVKHKTIKMLLTIAAIWDMEVKILDFKVAFLNGTLKEKIFCRTIPFYPSNKPYLRFKKALYGLKQASREWYLKIKELLISRLHFEVTPYDECLFFIYIKDDYGNLISAIPILITLWVDDMIILYPKTLEKYWLEIFEVIRNTFESKDLEEIAWILKMEIKRNREERKISLSQSAYAERIISEHKYEEVKEKDMPHYSKTIHDFASDMDKAGTDRNLTPAEITQYQHLVGELLYMALLTRIDLMYVVSVITRHQQNTKLSHLKYAQRVIKYLKYSASNYLIFGNIRNYTELKMEIYVDSDWGSDKLDRKSISGFVTMLNGSPIQWMSKKQQVVALSSMEAEFYALTEAVKEAIYWINLFKAIFNHDLKVTIYEDNTSTIDLADHSTNHHRTKHIEMRYFCIRDSIIKYKIKIEHIDSEWNHADLLTKLLPKKLFDRHVKALMITKEEDN